MGLVTILKQDRRSEVEVEATDTDTTVNLPRKNYTRREVKRALSSVSAGAGYTLHGQTEAAHIRGL